MKHATYQDLSGLCCDDHTMCPAARRFLDRLQEAVGLAISLNGESFEITGQVDLSNAGCTCVRNYHANADGARLGKAEHARKVH